MNDDFGFIAAMVALCVVILGVVLGINALIYGDPSCAIKHCVVVQEKK